MGAVKGETATPGSTIAEWYTGRSVLITGGTGLIGKVVVEKLLRCCPDINTIYMLVRPKKGKDANERLKDFTSSMAFSKLRTERPEFTQQLNVIGCDIAADDFRLAEDDLSMLRRDVSVVYHCAACVRFDVDLRTAVMSNVVATKRMLQLAEQLPHLKAFVHVSTSYCHSDYPVLEEKLYPPKEDPENIMEIVSWMDDDHLAAITPKLLHGLPNTYVFSKNLAEDLVARYSSSVPVAIARPSIISPAVKEPAPGWVDNTNGPVGISIAGAKGVLKILFGNAEAACDPMPVDFCANSIIVLARHIAEARPECPYVVNVTSGTRFPMTWGKVVHDLQHTTRQLPFEGGLSYPSVSMTRCLVWYTICHILFELVPAYILDFVILLSGNQPVLVKVHRRLATARGMISYYMLKEWLFINNRVLEMQALMSPEDCKTYYLDVAVIDGCEYFTNVAMGTKLYLLREDMANLPRCHTHQRRLYLLYVAIRVIFYGLLLWLMYSSSATITRLIESSIMYLTSLSTGSQLSNQESDPVDVMEEKVVHITTT